VSGYDVAVALREVIDAHPWLGGVFIAAGILAFAEAWHVARVRMKG